MQDMTHSFHAIVKIIITKLINYKYSHRLTNDINLKLTLTTYNINKCFGMIVKLNIIFITFSGRNKNKILSNSTKKKTMKVYCWETILNF